MKTRLLLFIFLPLLFALPAAAAECPSLLDHRYTTLQGGTVNLCDFADRPILVVNTASRCGFTPQFEKLEGMYKKYNPGTALDRSGHPVPRIVGPVHRTCGYAAGTSGMLAAGT